MEYRVNKRTGDKISVIGLGTAYIPEASESEAVKATATAPAPSMWIRWQG